MPNIHMTELDNGLRVITDTDTGVHSAVVGIWVGVGTRNEELMHNGVAHMVEHMLFKGTDNRNALEIAEVIENVGGHMNAYTGRELTSYHIHVLEDDVKLALDVLADMFQNYTMPEDELERERHVILQEIGMCNDTPDDLVFDRYQEAAYPNQSLGAPILGTEKYVKGMERSTLLDYICRFYTPSRTVISAAGNLDHETLVRQVEELFIRLPSDIRQGRIAADYQGGESREAKDLEQTHFMLGFQGLGRLDDDYFAAQAVSSVLGGGMSSRLFQEVREKRGLAYSIFSYHSGYQDDGQFAIYAGTGPDKLDEVIPVICEEVQGLSGQITEDELERAKVQLKAGILMGRESMMTRADQQAKYLLFREEPFNLNALIERIENIDMSTFKKTAQRIFSGPPTLAALGPLDKLEGYDAISERLAA